MPQYHYLTEEQVTSVLNHLESNAGVTVTRFRYRNNDEIRSTTQMATSELWELIKGGIEEGHLAGGDLEVAIPGLGQTLVGHHDGIFWLKPSA